MIKLSWRGCFNSEWKKDQQECPKRRTKFIAKGLHLAKLREIRPELSRIHRNIRPWIENSDEGLIIWFDVKGWEEFNMLRETAEVLLKSIYQLNGNDNDLIKMEG